MVGWKHFYLSKKENGLVAREEDVNAKNQHFSLGGIISTSRLEKDVQHHEGPVFLLGVGS